jgi:hypothetical protein
MRLLPLLAEWRERNMWHKVAIMKGPIGTTDKQRDYYEDFGQDGSPNFLVVMMMITIYETSGKIARRNVTNGDHVNCDYRRLSIAITTAL